MPSDLGLDSRFTLVFLHRLLISIIQSPIRIAFTSGCLLHIILVESAIAPVGLRLLPGLHGEKFAVLLLQSVGDSVLGLRRVLGRRGGTGVQVALPLLNITLLLLLEQPDRFLHLGQASLLTGAASGRAKRLVAF